jgi:hypothetical protein
MKLDLCSAVQSHFVEDVTVIFQFPHTALYHIVFQRVDEDKLIRMHGDPYVMLFYELTDFFKLLPEVASPVETAYGVRGERDQVRAYSKKIETMLNVVLQNFIEAG